MTALIRYLRKFVLLVIFALYVIFEITISSLKIARDVLTRRIKGKVGVIAIDIGSDTDIEIAILASLISLTPGTLTLDISTDKHTIFVHTVFADNIDKLKASIKKNLEKPLLEIMR
ncbi:MAG: Na+/H+ antiporter subunit E [Pseudomonadota bacterium]